MLTLSLFRHAKSAWDDPHLSDFDRPLAPRGIRAAEQMANFIAKNKFTPELVLCSTAVRARQTLELALPSFVRKPDVSYLDRLYLASDRKLLDEIHRISAHISKAMIVGHNPGMHVLAARLVKSAEPETLARLIAKLPTAALVVCGFEVNSWSEVSECSGRLICFATPKGLAN